MRAPAPRGTADAPGAVSVAFIAAYVVATVGIWAAVLTPVIEGLSLRINTLAPLKSASGDLSHVTLAGALCALIGNAFWGRPATARRRASASAGRGWPSACSAGPPAWRSSRSPTRS
jgi:hypothetical protein